MSTFIRTCRAVVLTVVTFGTGEHATHATDPAQWVWPLAFGMATLVALFSALSSAWTEAAADAYARRQKATRGAIFDNTKEKVSSR